MLISQIFRASIRCLAAYAVVGCVHLPVVHGSLLEGPQPADGVSVTVLLPRDAAADSTAQLLGRQGYTIAERSTQHLRSRPKVLGTDTTMIVDAYLIPADYDGPRTAVAFAATYSIRAMGIRDAQVRNEPTVPTRLWAELQMLETALRQLSAARR